MSGFDLFLHNPPSGWNPKLIIWHKEGCITHIRLRQTSDDIVDKLGKSHWLGIGLVLCFRSGLASPKKLSPLCKIIGISQAGAVQRHKDLAFVLFH